DEARKGPVNDIKDPCGRGDTPEPRDAEEILLEDASAPDVASIMDELRSARDLAERLSEENKTLIDASARARADFFNFRQRVERERERTRQLASESAAAVIIPVLDNLDRALSSPQVDLDSLKRGVQMVRDQIFSVLEGMGVSLIESIGKPFDPVFHEAVAIEEPEADASEGIITEEIQPGYIIAGKVIRAARVKVARRAS
ncbi:MAG: nucleotide exchange factor GrpE, partial [Thermovirgaceae bacterium]|nr:nucleotide exchange factor GrpE [Thermovirgaceae bacterium]